MAVDRAEVADCRLDVDWAEAYLQDTLLILATALVCLALLVDAFARENAYQLLACLGLSACQASQLVVMLATLEGRGDAASAVLAAASLLLLLASLLCARAAYLGFGWRMFSHVASAWRLKPAEQQRLRAAALARQRFAALARLDAALLAVMVVVAAVNAANPGAGQPQPVALLVGATAAAAPLLAAWLAACWRGVLPVLAPWAAALDYLFPLCYVLPLLIIYTAAMQGAQLAQPHGQPYLIVYPLLFLVARTAIWWASRQLSATRLAATRPVQQPGGSSRQALHEAVAGGAKAASEEEPEACLPAELLPLLRGAWLSKLAAGSGGMSPADSGTLGHAESSTSSLGGGSFRIPGSQLCCIGQWWRGSGSSMVRRGTGRHRFFQLSQDGACLRWSWGKWVLMPHVESIECCDESQTIRLQLLLEPDLMLGFPSRRQYREWRSGLRVLLDLLLQPEDLPACRASPGSSPTADGAAWLRRRSASPAQEVVLQVGPKAGASCEEPEAMTSCLAVSAGRVCARADSDAQLALATARSQAALQHAASQRQMAAGAGEGKAAGSGGGAPQLRRNTIQLVATASSRGDLTIKTSTSEGELESWPLSARPHQRRQGGVTRQQLPQPRSGAVVRLRSGLRRAITMPAALLRSSSAVAALQAGAAHASPSRQPLAGRGLVPSSSTDEMAGVERRQQQQQGTQHARKLTLASWGDLSPQLNQQQQQSSSLQGKLGEAGHGGRGSSPAAADPSTPGEAQPQSASRQRTPGSGQGGNGRLLLGGPFIHLMAFAGSGTSPTRRGTTLTPSPPPGPAAAGPSVGSSGASTPQHASLAGGSPLRGSGSPSQQQQLHSFQRYLQQQLQLQQRGRYGPSVVETGSAGGSATASGCASGTASPHGSPNRREREASPQSAGSPPNGAAQATALPPMHPVGAGYRVSPLAAGRQQQYFAARMQGAGSGNYEAAAEAAGAGATQHMPVWFDAGGDAGSAPISSRLPSWTAGSIGPLIRAESTFSSWGLPSPSTATARTPFNGLSRFNSFAPSTQNTPNAGFRQHASFAFMPQQQWQQGGISGPAGAPFAGAAHPHGGSMGGQGAAGSRRHDEGDGSRSDAAQSPDCSPTSMAVGGLGLGINWPVETVDFRDLVWGKFLGEGSEGSVYAAWLRETPVAVKRTRSLVEVEMNLHCGAHDNIVGLRGLCSRGSDLFLVMELCPRGTLDVLIHRGQGGTHRLDPNKLLPIVRSIARGMLHLHTRRPAVLLRDLKPGNLFIGHGGVVKVGDLGMSRYAAQWRGESAEGCLERTLTPGVIGTAAYSAPELLNPATPDADDRQLTPADEERILKADVYSFGVTLFEIMERRRPFAGLDGFQIQTQWYLDPHSMRLSRPSVPDGLPPPARQVMDALSGLVEACTQFNPDDRPTFAEILSVLRAAAGGAEPSAPPTPASIINPFG